MEKVKWLMSVEKPALVVQVHVRATRRVVALLLAALLVVLVVAYPPALAPVLRLLKSLSSIGASVTYNVPPSSTASWGL